VWLDVARYYVALDPAAFRMPAEDGLADWFDALHAEGRPDALRLVAETGGVVAGLVAATLQPPSPAARWQLVGGLDRPRVTVGALAVADTHRRSGVGSALMAAVERWAGERGAGTVTLDTYHASPLSIPFYEERLGYERHGVIFHKRLS
jgi:GNAT superfamily N-acetyltransferase